MKATEVRGVGWQAIEYCD